MHLACILGNLDIFKLLLGACYCANEGVDINKKTPLDYAKEKKHKELIAFLRTTTNTLYSIEKFTILAQIEEEKNKKLGKGRTGSKHLSLKNFNV